MAGFIRTVKSHMRRFVGERTYHGMSIVKQRTLFRTGKLREMLQRPGPTLPQLHAQLSHTFMSVSPFPELPESSPLRSFIQIRDLQEQVKGLNAAQTKKPKPAAQSSPPGVGLTEVEDPFSVVADLCRRGGKRAGTIFDVGAYRGTVTDRLRQSFPDAKFHLFEPQHDMVLSLRERYADDRNIGVHHLALYDASGEVPFNIGAFPPTSSIYGRSREYQYFDAKHVLTEVRSVAAMRLDEFCAHNSIESIDILKLDTQGAELSILRGAGELLSEQRIDIVCTEFFAIAHYEGAPLLDEIWSFLRGNGYELYRIFLGLNGPDGQLRYGDAIFLSRRYREKHLHVS